MFCLIDAAFYASSRGTRERFADALTKYAEKIAKIEEKLEQQKQPLRDFKAQETAQERKDDTRTKILYVAAFLSMLDQFTDGRHKASLDATHKVITRPKDENGNEP